MLAQQLRGQRSGHIKLNYVIDRKLDTVYSIQFDGDAK